MRRFNEKWKDICDRKIYDDKDYYAFRLKCLSPRAPIATCNASTYEL